MGAAQDALSAHLDRLRKAVRTAAPDVPKQILEAFGTVPRHIFVPEVHVYAEGEEPRTLVCDPDDPSVEVLRHIYDDKALPQFFQVAQGEQRITANSQPSLTAQILACLEISEGQRVLEVGAGTGYAAALLGHLVGADGAVVSVDIVPEFVGMARRAIGRLDLNQVQVVEGDGILGYPAGAPYDRVVGSVSFREPPRACLAQLKPKGLMAIPLRLIPGLDVVVLLGQGDEVVTGRGVLGCGYVPLLGEEQYQMAEWTRVAGDERLSALVEHESDSMQFVRALVSDETEGSDFVLWLHLHDEWAHILRDEDRTRGAGLALLDLDRTTLAAWWFGEEEICFYGTREARERLMGAYERWTDEGRPRPRDLRMRVWWGEARGEACGGGIERRLGSARCLTWFEAPIGRDGQQLCSADTDRRS